jgi:hypothetical protein
MLIYVATWGHFAFIPDEPLTRATTAQIETSYCKSDFTDEALEWDESSALGVLLGLGLALVLPSASHLELHWL